MPFIFSNKLFWYYESCISPVSFEKINKIFKVIQISEVSLTLIPDITGIN